MGHNNNTKNKTTYDRYNQPPDTNMRCLLAALVMSLSISRGSSSLGSEKRSLSTDPTSRMLESLQQIFPLLRFFFPQSQKRTLSIITRQLTRNTKTNNGHPNKIEKSRQLVSLILKNNQ